MLYENFHGWILFYFFYLIKPLLENDQSGTVILKTPSGLILNCIFFPQYNFFVLFLYIYNIGILLKPTSLRGQAHCHVTLPLQVLPERGITTQRVLNNVAWLS